MQIVLSRRGSRNCCVAFPPGIAASNVQFLAPFELASISTRRRAAIIITASPGASRTIGPSTSSATWTAPQREGWHAAAIRLLFSPTLCSFICGRRPAQFATRTDQPITWGGRRKQQAHGVVAVDGSDGWGRTAASCTGHRALRFAAAAAASRVRVLERLGLSTAEQEGTWCRALESVALARSTNVRRVYLRVKQTQQL